MTTVPVTTWTTGRGSRCSSRRAGTRAAQGIAAGAPPSSGAVGNTGVAENTGVAGVASTEAGETTAVVAGSGVVALCHVDGGSIEGTTNQVRVCGRYSGTHLTEFVMWHHICYGICADIFFSHANLAVVLLYFWHQKYVAVNFCCDPFIVPNTFWNEYERFKAKTEFYLLW